MRQTIDLALQEKKELSPAEYLALSDAERRDIESSRLVPPRLGSGSFGTIEVTYKTARYVPRKVL